MSVHRFPNRKKEGPDAKLERLAGVIADAALAENVPLATRIDAMKSLLPWFLARKKLQDKEPQESLFGTMTKAIAEASDKPQENEDGA